MDRHQFDALARLVTRRQSRRTALGVLLGAMLFGQEQEPTPARSRRRGRVSAQAVGDLCYPGTRCILGKGKNASRCDFSGTTDLVARDLRSANLSNANFSGADLRETDFRGANLSGSCFIGADLTGARLGASVNRHQTVFCNTVMPDGSIDDSGCDRRTACCPTCVEAGQPCGDGAAAACCGLGRCVDGVCIAPPTSCNPTAKEWTAQQVFGNSERPFGVAVSADGQTLWVADTQNDRITVWTRSGRIFVQQTAFGSRGSRPHQFNAPGGVAVAADGRTAWVADRGNHRVSVWVRSGNAWVNLTTFGSRGTGLGQLLNPDGIAVSPNGQTAWVMDLGNSRISVWTKSGNTWVNAATFGSRGDAPDQFRTPGGIAVSEDGQTVFVADTDNHRIAVWTTSGGNWVPLTTFGSRGFGPSQFRDPSSVAVSADGQTAWVVDTSNARIAVWIGAGTSWTNQTTFGSRGSRPNQFDSSLGVAVAADEQTVWVADTGNNRISVWALMCPPA